MLPERFPPPPPPPATMSTSTDVTPAGTVKVSAPTVVKTWRAMRYPYACVGWVYVKAVTLTAAPA